MAIPGNGLIQRIRMLLDPSSVEQAKAEARAGGKAVGAGFSEEAGQAASGAGKTAGRTLIRGLNREFDANMAELRRKLAMGLISEGEFRRRGTEAARVFNQGLLSGMNSLRASGTITERQFVSLSNRLKDTGNVGVSSFARIKEELRDLGTSALSQGIGLAGIAFVIRDASRAATRLQSDLTGLASTAEAFGQGQEEAQVAAQKLAEDGLMTVGDAATSLKNLLAAGFGLDQAIELMLRFKDAAAFGRQSSLGFGEAIRGATEGIKNGNSTLVDNAGVTKNLSVMLTEAGYSAQDLMNASSDAGIRMAIFNGIVKETSSSSGDAARYSGMAAGEFARMSAESEKAKANLGMRLLPVLGGLAKVFNTALNPTLQFFIALLQSVGVGIGGAINILYTAGGRFGIFWLEVIRNATDFAASALELAGKVPFVGRLLGIDPEGEDGLTGWLNDSVAKFDTAISSMEKRFMTFAQVNAAIDHDMRKIWEHAFDPFAPTVDVGDKPGVNREPGTSPETEEERDKSEKDRVAYLAQALEMEIATNDEHREAVSLMQQYEAASLDATTSLEKRVEAQDRYNRLEEALSSAARRSADAAEDRRKSLVEGLRLNTLNKDEVEELRQIELQLLQLQWDSTKSTKERVEAAKKLKEIQSVYADNLPDKEQRPEAGQRTFDFLMGTLEDFDPQDWFDELFYGIGTAAEDAAMGMADAWSSAFEQMLLDGASVGEAMKTLAKGMAAALTGALSSYARRKVGENVAEAIEQVARGIGALANPFTAPQAATHFASAAKHTAAAAAWGVLAGGASAATSALTQRDSGSSYGGGLQNTGGKQAEKSLPQAVPINVWVQPFNPNDPVQVKQIGQGMELNVRLNGKPDWAKEKAS